MLTQMSERVESLSRKCKICKDHSNFVRCKDICDVHMRTTVKLPSAYDQEVADRGKQGTSPLWTAIYEGCVHVVQLLVNLGHDINDGTKFCSPIAWAVFINKYKILQVLLHNGANPNGNYDRRFTLLQKAVELGYVEVARLLLAHGARADATNNESESALFVAASKRREEELMLLLRYGADVDQRDARGLGVLHALIIDNEVRNTWDPVRARSLMKQILDLGGDVNLGTSSSNETPLHYAARFGRANMFFILPQYVWKVYTGYRLPFFCNESSASVILQPEYGAKVDARNALGETPLHLAVKSGCLSPIIELLHAQADPDVVDQHGNTPLGLAVARGSYVAMKHLLLANADPYPFLDHHLDEAVRVLFTQFLIARRAAGFTVSRDIAMNESLKAFERKCLGEVEYMRTNVLDGTGVSILSFLRANKRRAAAIIQRCRSASFLNIFTSKHAKRLTTYCEMLEYRYFVALRYAPHLKSAASRFEAVIEYRLPLELCEVIVDMLNLDDLRSVIETIK